MKDAFKSGFKNYNKTSAFTDPGKQEYDAYKKRKELAKKQKQAQAQAGKSKNVSTQEMTSAGGVAAVAQPLGKKKKMVKR
jgi:hypothetical protein